MATTTVGVPADWSGSAELPLTSAAALLAPEVRASAEPAVQTSLWPCNLCGSTSYSVLFEAGVAQANRILRCSCCQLLYADPTCRKVDIEKIKTYDPGWVLKQIQTTHRWRAQKESLQVRDYGAAREFLAQRFPRRGRLLEVGCGMGHLLKLFHDDRWNALGLEPNTGLCEYARRVLGLATVSGTLEEVKFGTNSFDAAIMAHVIEHVPDPMRTLKELYRILTPGGCLVLETPRYDTATFRVLRHRERSISCDGHIYFFTTDTLRTMVTAAGFRVLRTDYVGRSLSLDRLLYNVGVVSKNSTIKHVLRHVSKALQLHRVTMTLNLRDMQRLYVERPLA